MIAHFPSEEGLIQVLLENEDLIKVTFYARMSPSRSSLRLPGLHHSGLDLRGTPLLIKPCLSTGL